MTAASYWQALRWHLLAWVLIILSGSVATGIYLFHYSTLENELLQVQQQLRTEQQKITQESAYQKDIGFFLSHKDLWRQLGLDSAADPSLWIDDWHVLQLQSQLPHMQYDIQPSTACEGLTCHQFLPVANVNGASMTITPVNMRWSVRHESDILNWLQLLQHKYAGMLLVRGCQWSVTESAALIDAHCELQWFNFPGSFPVSLSAT